MDNVLKKIKETCDKNMTDDGTCGNCPFKENNQDFDCEFVQLNPSAWDIEKIMKVVNNV